MVSIWASWNVPNGGKPAPSIVCPDAELQIANTTRNINIERRPRILIIISDPPIKLVKSLAVLTERWRFSPGKKDEDRLSILYRNASDKGSTHDWQRKFST